MKKQRILRWTALGLLASALSGCSTIKSWFPDKERDYQFTSEIPELIVPEDLKNKGLPSLSSESSVQAADTEPSEPVSIESDQDAGIVTESTTEASPVAETEQTQAQAASKSSVSGVASSLQIDQAKTPATRMVGRALSRKQIEIVERNIEKGYFYVNFDPNAEEAKDESIWDEIAFLFGDDPSQEQEYRITVHQISEQMSEVTVQDSDGKTLSDNVANALLRLITDGINEVMNQDATADDSPDATEQQAPDASETKQ